MPGGDGGTTRAEADVVRVDEVKPKLGKKKGGNDKPGIDGGTTSSEADVVRVDEVKPKPGKKVKPKPGKNKSGKDKPGIDGEKPNIDVNKFKLRLGGKGKPLLPKLVPPAGSRYQFLIREHASLIARNDYSFYFNKICEESACMNYAQEHGLFLRAEGDFWTNRLGTRAVNVVDREGKRILKIRRNRKMVNPRGWLRESFRVFPGNANVKNLAHTLFTINRDFFGRGILWLKDEWRIYRGRKRHGEQIYYARGGYFQTWSHHDIFRTNGSFTKQDPGIVAGRLQKIFTKRGIVGDLTGVGDWLPDRFELDVNEGEDSGILLTLALLCDMASDRFEYMRKAWGVKRMAGGPAFHLGAGALAFAAAR
eukprot:TRINITY_DN2412_c0_g1_i1.p1 TRINITY_DN2412_c0_g1~~TRINITY_DN2412_c0_g1_i1.p1  ORF type:complete len:365 (+),score=45.24 TRINITY_DN2412_c0_g1_i1:372-1466(+)